MNIIKPDPVSLTTHHLHLGRTDSDLIISSATGFIYKRNDQHFIITNWHVVTGTSPETGTISGIPTVLLTAFRMKQGRPGSYAREILQLYVDGDANNAPLWLEHPIHRKHADVVALPLAQELVEKYELFPINAIPFNNGFNAEVADDAFVIGYPFFETPYLQLPIWKKASIASEPSVNIDQVPKLLIDATTRPGMSGSPVIVQRTGIHGLDGGRPVASTILGRIRWFLGVYSGRRGVDQFSAQLGIVWKAKLIDELLDAPVTGAV